jgi:16S rRNA (adenine1518-N6/adenine1519-N6)-dimethyltransferase
MDDRKAHATPVSHTARKRFGQHFLHDRHFVARIIEAINPQRGERVVEIGPGLGALTQPLLTHLDHLDVVEIDRDIVAHLHTQYNADTLTVHEGDALRFDFAALGENLRIVGNLPYNISTPLLFHLSAATPHIRDMIFMLQKEVVDRMVAAPGGKDYGKLSVMLQVKFAMQRLFIVPPGAFRPPPKVDSAIVRLQPLGAEAPHIENATLFAEIVSAGFNQRRKMLRQSLKQFFNAEDFAKLCISAEARAEQLTVEDFVRCANLVAARRDE